MPSRRPHHPYFLLLKGRPSKNSCSSCIPHLLGCKHDRDRCSTSCTQPSSPLHEESGEETTNGIAKLLLCISCSFSHVVVTGNSFAGLWHDGLEDGLPCLPGPGQPALGSAAENTGHHPHLPATAVNACCAARHSCWPRLGQRKNRQPAYK